MKRIKYTKSILDAVLAVEKLRNEALQKGNMELAEYYEKVSLEILDPLYDTGLFNGEYHKFMIDYYKNRVPMYRK